MFLSKRNINTFDALTFIQMSTDQYTLADKKKQAEMDAQR